MRNEKMLNDLKHYKILEVEMQKQRETGINTIELDALTQENIQFCKDALELLTIEEDGFFKKVALPFDGKVTVLKDKLIQGTETWSSHISIQCTYAEGEGLLGLEDKGTIVVDMIFKSNESFRLLNNSVINYMAYDKEEEVFGFIVTPQGSKETILFTANCENVEVFFHQ